MCVCVCVCVASQFGQRTRQLPETLRQIVLVLEYRPHHEDGEELLGVAVFVAGAA
jgi:hypothetical protein